MISSNPVRLLSHWRTACSAFAALVVCAGSVGAASPHKLAASKSTNPIAVIQTNLGKIQVELFPHSAPKTVSSFIGLAEGTRAWTDPRTGQQVHKPLYSGTIFHRVIPHFMIQGGDPLGTGTGGPGYQIVNEIDPALTFDRPGRLAMANAGPDTNGSQFFITTNAYPSLNGNYTIFGQVLSGQSVVDTISNVARDPADRPLRPVVIQKITILQPGAHPSTAPHHKR